MKLRRLDVGRAPKITDEGIVRICDMFPELGELFLEYCNIGDLAAKFVSSMRSLSTLDMSRCQQLTPEG